MKYYIVKINPLFPENSRFRKEYKQYKCSDGFTNIKEKCWKFSKQGAMKIIERLKREYWRNPSIEFFLEEAGE